MQSDHNERSEKTKVNRSEEEIESTELDELLKQATPYEPRINGTINPEFVDVNAKIQFVKTLNGDRSKFKVGERIVEARQKRITEHDKECAEKSREKVFCGDRNICEEAIQRYGDEIIGTMKCVAILNAPQTHADHKGAGKLYLTKRKVTPLEKGKDTKEKTSYRLFYYSYGEDPSYKSVEKTSDLFGQALELMEENTLLKIRAGSVIKVTTEDSSFRGAQGIFVSLALDDLISAHHRVSDTTEMRNFVESEASFRKELDCLNCKCDCLKYCLLPCVACTKLCTVCTCKMVICRADAKYWEWVLRAGQSLDSLSDLVSGRRYEHEYNPEQLVFNPLDKTDLVMSTTTNRETNWRRYHTVNFTHMDRDGDNMKHRTVVVMDPDEDTKHGIDLVCHLTALLDSKEHGWNNVAKMHPRDPMAEHGHLLRTHPTVAHLLSDTLMGNIDIHLEVSYFYRVNHVWVLILALIGLCLSFAFIVDEPLLALNGLYSTVHLLDRVYNFRHKEFNRVTAMKDMAYAAFGLLFTIVGGSTVRSDDQGGAAAVAFTFLQGFFAFCGSAYQLAAHFTGRDTTHTPMFEAGHSIAVSDSKV